MPGGGQAWKPDPTNQRFVVGSGFHPRPGCGYQQLIAEFLYTIARLEKDKLALFTV